MVIEDRGRRAWRKRVKRFRLNPDVEGKSPAWCRRHMVFVGEQWRTRQEGASVWLYQ